VYHYQSTKRTKCEGNQAPLITVLMEHQVFSEGKDSLRSQTSERTDVYYTEVKNVFFPTLCLSKCKLKFQYFTHQITDITNELISCYSCRKQETIFLCFI